MTLGGRVELDPEIAATPCAEFVNSITQIRITRTMSWFTSIFAIVIGAIGVMNTMAMSVFERRGEIVTLRAIGWRKWRIARMIEEVGMTGGEEMPSGIA